jgi:hypothetical protein
MFGGLKDIPARLSAAAARQVKQLQPSISLVLLLGTMVSAANVELKLLCGPNDWTGAGVIEVPNDSNRLVHALRVCCSSAESLLYWSSDVSSSQAGCGDLVRPDDSQCCFEIGPTEAAGMLMSCHACFASS